MIIEIHDRELAEPEALEAALGRTLRQQHVAKVEIFITPRMPEDAPEWKYPGWLEYGIRYEYESGSTLYVGMIQRRPGEPFEFHS